MDCLASLFFCHSEKIVGNLVVDVLDAPRMKMAI
jgi:hypothetical protein